MTLYVHGTYYQHFNFTHWPESLCDRGYVVVSMSRCTFEREDSMSGLLIRYTTVNFLTEEYIVPT